MLTEPAPALSVSGLLGGLAGLRDPEGPRGDERKVPGPELSLRAVCGPGWRGRSPEPEAQGIPGRLEEETHVSAWGEGGEASLVNGASGWDLEDACVWRCRRVPARTPGRRRPLPCPVLLAGW